MSNTDAINLPELILFEDYSGNWEKYIEAVYMVFKRDFVNVKPIFRGKRLALKRHPIFQDREYTFYHMTHEGKIEDDRTPDIRRCERIGWAKPTIENCDKWKLKVWPQIRNGKNRLCIWLEMGSGEPDYIMILDDRKDYILPWTAFVLNYEHEKRKKQKEYDEYIKSRSRP